MSKFITANEIVKELDSVKNERQYDDVLVDLLDKEYISKEVLLEIINRLQEFDAYHRIGKGNVWSMSNDSVVDATQAILIKELKEELERD